MNPAGRQPLNPTEGAMAHRLEITLKPELFDAEGEGIRHKAADYFDIRIRPDPNRQILTIDADLTADQLETIRTEVFTNPVTQVSAYTPLNLPFDWAIWVGYRPGCPGQSGQHGGGGHRRYSRS
jgi:phosphoribosylformylglycinamidine (FGAM) synthase PurS component